MRIAPGLRPHLPAAALALAIFVLLAAFVGVDPARGVTSSASPWADEGFNAINAHNLALLGRLSTDQWNLWLVNLPFTALLAAVFRVFGGGIVQARLMTITATALTVGLLGIGLGRAFGRRAALVAAAAFGTSLLTLYYGRLVYLEDLQVLTLTAGALSLGLLDGRRPGLLGALAGTCFAIAVGTKPGGAFAVAGLLAFVALFEARRSPAVRRWLGGAIAALLVIAVAWGLLVALPNLATLRANVGIWPSLTWPATIQEALRRATGFAGHGGDRGPLLMAPLLLSAAAGSVVALVRRAELRSEERRLIVAAAGWFVLGMALLLEASYRPNRYLVPLLPALAILTAPLAGELDRWAARRLPAAGRIAASIALAGALAAQGLVSYGQWMAAGTQHLPALQASMRSAVPEGAVVVGPEAPVLLMSAPVAVVVPDWGSPPVNSGDLYDLLGARWYVTNEGATVASVARAHPGAWAGRRAVACGYWFSGSRCLYRLP